LSGPFFIHLYMTRTPVISRPPALVSSLSDIDFRSPDCKPSHFLSTNSITY
jgi:hypothetical protein